MLPPLLTPNSWQTSTNHSFQTPGISCPRSVVDNLQTQCNHLGISVRNICLHISGKYLLDVRWCRFEQAHSSSGFIGDKKFHFTRSLQSVGDDTFLRADIEKISLIIINTLSRLVDTDHKITMDLEWKQPMRTYGDLKGYR